jgi:hypothetical protein
MTMYHTYGTMHLVIPFVGKYGITHDNLLQRARIRQQVGDVTVGM